MTNREFILSELAKASDARMIDLFETLYGYEPKNFPMCQEQHGGECPDDSGEDLCGTFCDAAEAAWLDAEAVPV